jgi:hypothetical protein
MAHFGRAVTTFKESAFNGALRVTLSNEYTLVLSTVPRKSPPDHPAFGACRIAHALPFLRPA